MLRITGIVALILSALLGVAFFIRVHATDVSGTVWSSDSGSLWVNLSEPRPRSQDLNYFSAGTTHTDDHHVVALIFDDIHLAARELPEGAEVQVSQRQVVFVSSLMERLLGRLVLTYEGTRITSGGHHYPWGPSIPAFYTILTMASLSPLLVWSVISLALSALRKPSCATAAEGRAPGIQP